MIHGRLTAMSEYPVSLCGKRMMLPWRQRSSGLKRRAIDFGSDEKAHLVLGVKPEAARATESYAGIQ